MIRYGLGFLVAASALSASALVACGEEANNGNTPIPVGGGGSSGAGGGTPGGGGGPAAGGSATTPQCVGGCCPTDPTCYSTSAGNGSPGSECLAEADNGASPTRIQMRQRWINIQKPAGLELAAVYGVLNSGTQLPQPQCNSLATASTGYMQLIDFDLSAGESFVGFAKYIPAANVGTAVSTGFCMAEKTTPWSNLPQFMGATVNMPIPAAELYTGADAGFPDGLVDPMAQPWTTRRTHAKRLDADFNLTAQSTDPAFTGKTQREEILTKLKPGGAYAGTGAEPFNAVFYFDEATGSSHGYSPMNWQVIYGSTGADYILVPIREPETRSRFNDKDRPNCVGKYRADALPADTGCQPGTSRDAPDFYAWGGVNNPASGEGDASTEGYFLIVELEQVWTNVLNMSLCVLYPDPTNPATWGQATTPKQCRQDPRWNSLDPVGGLPPGDWCAATNSAATATCHDAYQVKSFHAFAATKIQDAACAAD